jgi:hypothetical protein
MKRTIKSWKALGLALLAFGLAALAHADKEPSFAVPQGVTLQAKPGGRYLLYWDPIDADNLMGYSVWLRHQGEKEFVRLSVPVKVGKEIQKQPMVSASKLELKLGEGRKDLEFAVVAEYEDGPSLRSESVFSATALRTLAAVPDASGATLAADASGSSPTALAEPAKRDPYADDDAKTDQGQTNPWDKTPERLDRPLILKPGKWSTSLGIDFSYTRSIYSGNDTASNLPILLSGVDPNSKVNWQETQVRTIFEVPLEAHVGIFPSVEAWARGSFNSENAFTSAFSENGRSADSFRRVDSNGVTLAYPNSVSAGDTWLGVRLQPLDSSPFVLGLSGSIPTGISRMQSYLEASYSTNDSPAGTGEGVTRLKLDLDYGWRGIREGVSLHAGYMPSALETFTRHDLGFQENHAITHGEEGEAGVGYTIPWVLASHDGALILGGLVRSVAPVRWQINGQDVAFDSNQKVDRGRVAAWGGLKFIQDNQLELSVEAQQLLPGGFRTGGKLSYTMESDGDSFGISGQLYY